jgi:ribose-phosphate pyrophosphokinase
MPNGLRVFSGDANRALASAICSELDTTLGVLNTKQFADKEQWIEFGENVRGVDVFLVQPTCAPCNDNLMQLMLMIDAAKRASAARITAVIPYYGYARQDRKDRPRVPISAKVVATMLEGVGADRILAMDLHNAAIGGFFEVPVDHLYALPVFVDYAKAKFGTRLTVVSPDAGGVARARLLAMKLGAPLAIVDKYREAANVSEVMNVIGTVEDRDCLLVDDLVDTAGTLCKGAKALMDRGAKSVSAVASHGVLSYDHKEDISAIDKIENSCLREVIVTDTIDQTGNLGRLLRDQRSTSDEIQIRVTKKLKVLSVASLFAQAIQAIHNDESVSGLFV